MYAKHAELKAGIVMLLALAALLALLYLASGETFWGSWRYVHIRVESGRLSPQADDPVLMNGLTVGRVASVELQTDTRKDGQLTAKDRDALGLAPEAPGSAREIYAHVVARLEKGTVLPRGTYGQVSESITGNIRLDLFPGRHATEEIRDEDTETTPIIAYQVPSLADVFDQVGRITGKLERAAEGGVKVMDDARVLIAQIQKKVEAVKTEAISAEAQAAVGALKRTFENLETKLDAILLRVGTASEDLTRMSKAGADTVEQLQKDARDLLATLNEAAKKADDLLAKADPKIQKFLDSLNRTGAGMESLARDLQGIGPKARTTLDSVGGDLGHLVKVLTDAGHNLVDATEEIKVRPWILLNEPDEKEIAFDNLRSAAANYAKAGTQLREAAEEIRLLLARPDAGSPQVRALLQDALARFEGSRDRYRQIEEQLLRLMRAAPR